MKDAQEEGEAKAKKNVVFYLFLLPRARCRRSFFCFWFSHEERRDLRGGERRGHFLLVARRLWLALCVCLSVFAYDACVCVLFIPQGGVRWVTENEIVSFVYHPSRSLLPFSCSCSLTHPLT
jgi:hypothetical protein